MDQDSNNKYKSYIQRRRVGQDDSTPQDNAEFQNDEASISELDDENLFKDFSFNKGDKSHSLLSYTKTEDANDISVENEYSNLNHDHSFTEDIQYNDDKGINYEPRTLALPPLLRKGYRSDKSPYKSNYPNSYSETNNVANDDNKPARLSIKVIKQALACFAILGVIVFLQNRNEGTVVLDFLRTNIVDKHTELQDLTLGFKDIIAECAKLFNTTP